MRLFVLPLVLLPCVVTAQAKPAAAPRPRVVYVIDMDSELPIAGAVVRDLITRNSMETSVAGAVGLFVPAFVRQTGALIEVKMDGYITSERLFVDPMVDTAIVIGLVKMDSPRAHGVVRLRTDSTIFHVEVLDDTGSHMPDAQVSIVRGVSTALASAVTDTTGLRTLVVPEVSGDVQITVLRLGYAPYRQFYRLNIADTVVAQVAMHRQGQRLGAVTVTAKRNERRQLYHVTENEIATSRRPLLDGLDVVRKLRPDLLGRRTASVPGCGQARRIFVNGRLVRYPPQSVDLAMVPRGLESARSLRGSPFATKRGLTDESQLPNLGGPPRIDIIRAILAGIKPEHIAEMTYLDCFDTTVPGVHSNSALFVVLKFGVGYSDQNGSYFLRDSTVRK